MIFEEKFENSLRISVIEPLLLSSPSTKSRLNAGTLMFSGSKKSRLLDFSVESGWTCLFSGALWIVPNLEKLDASLRSPLASGVR